MTACRVAVVLLLCSGLVLVSSTSVSLPNGTVVGEKLHVDGRDVWQFLGIPYAEPPVGELRFLSPQPLRHAWPQPLEATSAPSACLQPSERPLLAKWPAHLHSNFSEDCLVLSVWTPGLIGRRPVLVWIHGGGFVAGETLPLYDGRALAAVGDLVVVSVQYRLGILGFGAGGSLSGNVGLQDQRQALRWVREHVQAFGGDPGAVTLAGESAGGASVSLHLLASPKEKLFHRALILSASPLNQWAVNPQPGAMETLTRAAAARVGCGADADLLRCLQAVPGSSLVRAATAVIAERPGAYWSPTVDGHFLSQPPQELLAAGVATRVPVMIGVAADEGAFFVHKAGALLRAAGLVPGPLDEVLDHPTAARAVAALFRFLPHFPVPASPQARQLVALKVVSHRAPNRPDFNARAMADALGDFLLYCGVNAMADALRQWQASIYFFELTRRPAVPLLAVPQPAWAGATHGDVLPFLFALPLAHQHRAGSMSAEEETLARRLIADVAAFARTGRPHNFRWPPYSPTKKEVFQYGAEKLAVRNFGIRRDECIFWDRVLPLVNRAAGAASTDHGARPTSAPATASAHNEL